MELTANRVRIKDTGANKTGTLLEVFPPIFQPAFTAVIGGAVTAGYFAAPTPAQCFALIAWDDNTLHIQTLNNLTLLP